MYTATCSNYLNPLKMQHTLLTPQKKKKKSQDADDH